jgi:protein-L-isoaspartate(D-aspartate) O-methyltransferase
MPARHRARHRAWASALFRASLAALAIAGAACDRPRALREPMPSEIGKEQARARDADGDRRGEGYADLRGRMVEQQLVGRDITDQRVLQAMRVVPRHRFVPASVRAQAYADSPLPIGYDQTISQPYIVAYMTQALRLGGSERVLEIGTGSGYQAAVLARLCKQVYSIEIIPELARRAGETLASLGYANVSLRVGDGYRGWPEEAPFDAIILTASPPQIPQPLVEQLAPGGRMVAPVGRELQDLVVLEKTPQGVTQRTVMPVRFVPMTGEAQRP